MPPSMYIYDGCDDVEAVFTFPTQFVDQHDPEINPDLTKYMDSISVDLIRHHNQYIESVALLKEFELVSQKFDLFKENKKMELWCVLIFFITN